MVKADIYSVTKNDADNSNVIRYRITNLYDKNIYLVADNWFTFAYDNAVITLIFARTKMIESIRVFGYFSPAVQLIKPNESVNKEWTLAWPLQLNTIWNKEAYAKPPQGLYELKIIVGYGFTEKIEEHQELSVEENVLNWQQTAESSVCDMSV